MIAAPISETSSEAFSAAAMLCSMLSCATKRKVSRRAVSLLDPFRLRPA